MCVFVCVCVCVTFIINVTYGYYNIEMKSNNYYGII